VADSEYLENPLPPMDGVDDAKALYAVFPKALEFRDERLPQGGVPAQCPEGGLDAALEVRREVADDLGDVGWDIRVEGLH